MEKKKKKRNYKAIVIAVILLLMLTISVGYATLSGNILLKGTTKIKANSWGLQATNIANVKENGNIVNENAEGYPSINNNYTDGETGDKIAITYTANLASPGDIYEFEFTVENKGSLPVQLSAVPSFAIGDNIKDYVDLSIEKVVTGSNVTITDSNLAASRIDKGGNITYKIKVVYKDDNNYPENDVQSTAVITLSYEQSPTSNN